VTLFSLASLAKQGDRLKEIPWHQVCSRVSRYLRLAGTGNLDIFFPLFDASASALIIHAPEHTFNNTTGLCCVFQFGGFNLHPRMFCAVFRARNSIF
jgi:hypothetical protein